MHSANPGTTQKGMHLDYKLSWAELHNIAPNNLPAWLTVLANNDFFEKAEGFDYFLKDFTRNNFCINELQLLGFDRKIIDNLLNINRTHKQQARRMVVDQVALLLKCDVKTAEAITNAASQNAVGFVSSIATTGIEQNLANPIMTNSTPDEDGQPSTYVDIFKNSADNKIYMLSITKHIRLLAMDEDGATQNGLMPGISLVLSRLENHRGTQEFRFVRVEFQNHDLYLMAKNQKIPASELKNKYFSSPPKAEIFNYTKSAKEFKDKFIEDTKDCSKKLAVLDALRADYETHLRSVILTYLNPSVFESVSVAKITSKDSNATLPEIIEIGELLRSIHPDPAQLKLLINKHPGLVHIECQQAIVKLMIIMEMHAILTNKDDPNDRLDKFEYLFWQNKPILEQIRDTWHSTSGAKFLGQKIVGWIPEGKKFIARVEEKLNTSEVVATIKPANSASKR